MADGRSVRHRPLGRVDGLGPPLPVRDAVHDAAPGRDSFILKGGAFHEALRLAEVRAVLDAGHHSVLLGVDAALGGQGGDIRSAFGQEIPVETIQSDGSRTAPPPSLPRRARPVGPGPGPGADTAPPPTAPSPYPTPPPSDTIVLDPPPDPFGPPPDPGTRHD